MNFLYFIRIYCSSLIARSTLAIDCKVLAVLPMILVVNPGFNPNFQFTIVVVISSALLFILVEALLKSTASKITSFKVSYQQQLVIRHHLGKPLYLLL